MADLQPSPSAGRPREREEVTKTIPVDQNRVSEAIQIVNNVDRDDGNHSEVSEDIDLAVLLMDECKAELSIANLETCITLLREIVEQCTPEDPLYFETLFELASSLGVRFLHIKDQANFDECMGLLGWIWGTSKPVISIHSNSDDNDTKGMLELAKTSLVDFHKSTSLSTVNTIIFLLQQALADLAPGHQKRGLAVANLTYGMYMRFHHTNNLSDVKNAMSMLKKGPQEYVQGEQQDLEVIWQLLSASVARAGGSTASSNSQEWISPALGSRYDISPESGEALTLFDFAESLLQDSYKTGNMDDADHGIALMQSILTETSESDLYYAFCLGKLAKALLSKFQNRGDVRDLDEAISFCRRALKFLHSPDPNRPHVLNNLALALWTRFKEQGNAQDLDESTAFQRQALNLYPSPHPERSNSLSNLATGLLTRFNQLNEAQDLDDAISFYREGLNLVISRHGQTPKPGPPPRVNRSDFVNNLAETLWTRFQQRGDAQDLDEVISINRQVLELRPQRHPDLSNILPHLAQPLLIRFEQRGDIKDISEAISFYRLALELIPSPHPDRWITLDGLASALLAKFQAQGNVHDLDECLVFYRLGLELRPPSHPEHPQSLNNLGHALWVQFEKRGDGQDLDEAISMHRQALVLRPPPHTDSIIPLGNLAIALWTRFKHQGDDQDLNEAISLYRRTLELRPPHHPDHCDSLHNLASALLTRFDKRGDIQDLDEAISYERQVLELLPPVHPHRFGSLMNIAYTLMKRSGRRDDIQDLNEAISFYRKGLELVPPPHPESPGFLTNLGSALSQRFERRGDAQDINEAISMLKQALELRPAPHPMRLSSLINYVTTLSARNNAQDLDEALSVSAQVLELLPSSHPDRPTFLQIFGDLHLSAYARMYSAGASPYHLDQAMLLLSDATRSVSQSPSGRFGRACHWALAANKLHHPSALEAYDTALGILPQLAALNLDIQSRQNALVSQTDGLSRGAAGCAIRDEKLDKAVEYLETGRGVFWSQFLSLRSPIDMLRDVAPELEQDLRRISKALEVGSHRSKPMGELSNRQKLSLEEEAQKFEQLAQEWSETVDKVRDLDGFGDFLRPQKLSTLQIAAERHPVVYLVANDDTSNCLIITADGVHHIPLPTLTADVLLKLVKLVQMATLERPMPLSFMEEMEKTWETLKSTAVNGTPRWRDIEDDRGMTWSRRGSGVQSSDVVFRLVLRMLWAGAVKPVIDFLGLEKSSKPLTLTWCATGLFTFLPIHAAGCYDEGAVDCASDYIISSYTPTIGALLTQDPPPPQEFKVMAVIQSQTLPSTREELKKIERHIGGDSLIKFGVPGAPASVEAVASRLSDASIVHFACHGKQDSNQPLESGLEIGHERLSIARIMKESVPNGSLAFLSACETAMGDEKIPDESMSIGASLLFSGFRSVVATMWRMWDEDGPVIADTFYKELLKGPDGNPLPRPDTRKSAEALSVAVNELRARGVPFKRWVPFIHMGK